MEFGRDPSALRDATILPLVQKLDNSDPSLREQAARQINELVGDQTARRLFLKEQLVRRLLQHVSVGEDQKPGENDWKVANPRLNGWKLLQTLASKEGLSFGIHLFRQGILKSLDTEFEVLHTRLFVLPDPEPLPSEDRNVWDIAELLVELTRSLALTNEGVVTAITKLDSVPRIFVNLIVDGNTPELLKIKAAHCLASLSRDNVPLANKIQKHGLKDLEPMDRTLLNIVLCQLRHNVSRSQESAMKNRVEGRKLRQESDLLTLPLLKTSLADYTRQYVSANGNATVLPMYTSGTEEAVQISLEVIAAISSDAVRDFDEDVKAEAAGGPARAPIVHDQDPGEDEDMDEGDNEGPESDEDAEMAEMVGLIDGDSDQEVEELGEGDEMKIDKPLTFMSCLIDGITPLVLNLAVSRRRTTVEVLMVRSLAISALNKIAWTMSAARVPLSTEEWNRWASQAQKIWTNVVSPVLSSNTADLDMANRITNLAWALADSCGGEIEIIVGEEQKFIALYQATTSLAANTTTAFPALAPALAPTLIKKKLVEHDDEATTLSVKCIGVLGRLALRPNSVPLNRTVGHFILSIVENAPHLPVPDLVEALNQLFDIYGDMTFDYDEPVFWGNNGFVGRLEAALPTVQKIHKRVDMRKDPELRGQAAVAGKNLSMFIAYKKKEKQGQVEPGEFYFDG